MSLPESLERAASELDGLADQIRPANGDPTRLLDELSSADAGQLLVWLLMEEPEAAAEMIEVWSESDQGAAILLATSDEGVPKIARKALRRARHRLRSQGIEAPTPAPSPTSSSTRRRTATADRWQAAHISAPDFRGARIGYLVDSHPNGGARLFEARFDEARGILDFKVYSAGRSKVRGFLRSLTSGTDQHLFDVDQDALCALIRRASLAQPVDRPLPAGFVEWRGRLFPEALDAQPTPGDQVKAALASTGDVGGGSAEADQSAALETTVAEIAAGRLGPWPPATAWVSERMETGREAVEGLEGTERGTAIDAWLSETAESLAKETSEVLIAHHLDEVAWVRWRSEAEEAARALLRVSEAIGRDGEVMQRICRARVEGLFAAFLQELRVQEEEGLPETEV